MKKSANVLQFMCYNAPYGGNFIKSLVRLEETIKVEGLEMIYLFYMDASDKDWVQKLIAEDRKVYFLSGKYVKDILFVKRILSTHNIKFIHTHFSGAKYHILFNIAKKLYRNELFIIRHLHNHYYPGNFIAEAFKNLATHIDLYIGCGESVAIHFQKAYKINPGKITFVPNAIDFDRLNVFEAIDKAQIGVDPDAAVFLMFGFDYLRKGVDIALEAIDDLIGENYNVCLLLSLSINKEYIESKIYEKFNSMPKWLKILEPRDDVGSYYRLCDCFLSSSRAEGLCYSLIEAAYLERSIIASDIPGHTSLKIPDINTFPVADKTGLEKEIISVISRDKNQTIQTALRNKEYIVRNFDLNVWAHSIFTLFKQVPALND